MSSYGKNVGYEQNGSGERFSRPVIIVKKLNNQMFLGIPLSTRQKDLDFYLNFIDPKGNNVSAIVAQMRLTSVKRLRRKMYKLPEAVFSSVKESIRALLS